VIARIASAKSLLEAHHSAQRVGADRVRMSKNAAASWLVQGAPRYPFWSCRCGAHDNWGDRKACRQCQADPPSSVLRRQREAQEARRGGGGGGGGSGGGGGAKQQRGGGGGGGGGARTGSATRAASSTSYAEAARNGHDKLATELAEVRRNNERLQKQIAALQAGRSMETVEVDDEDGDDGGAAEKVREGRIKTLNDHLRGVAAVFGEDSAEHKAKRAELDDLLRQKRECKPLNVQLQRVDKRIDGQRKKLAKAEEQVSLEQRRLKEAQSDLEAAHKEVADAKACLGTLEEERKQLLLRETQAQAAPPEPSPTAKADSEAEAWERTLAAINVRVQSPGVHADLAAQVAATVTALRNLCGQLPAVPAAALPPPPHVPTFPIATPPSGQSAAGSTDAASSAAGAGTGAGAAAPTPHAAALPPAERKDDDDGGGEEGFDDATGDELDIDEEGSGSRISPSQRERIRELMGRRPRRKPAAGKLKDAPEDKKGDAKKPAKGGE
jgi:flagellar biosynthesis chaperone FliJ